MRDSVDLVVRMEELLADRAMGALDETQEAELDRLMAQHPQYDHEAFDRAAAMVALAGISSAPAPQWLERKIAENAEQHFGFRGESVVSLDAKRPRTKAQSGPESVHPHSVRDRAWLGWVAAAASFTFALFAWWPNWFGPYLPSSEPGPGTELASNQAIDALRIAWSATDDPHAGNASGEVVWSTQVQQGSMRFQGLPVNDPERFQYQLWIFDQSRPDSYPVDGGVFNITRDDESVTIPIDAKLDVRNPTLFAVTVEQPGGVVVSDRKHIVVLAKVGEG